MTKEEKRFLVDAYEHTRENADYKAYTANVIMLGRKIMKLLGNQSSLLLDFEMMIGLSQGIYLENVYKIGVIDGQKEA